MLLCLPSNFRGLIFDNQLNYQTQLAGLTNIHCTYKFTVREEEASADVVTATVRSLDSRVVRRQRVRSVRELLREGQRSRYWSLRVVHLDAAKVAVVRAIYAEFLANASVVDGLGTATTTKKSERTCEVLNETFRKRSSSDTFNGQ